MIVLDDADRPIACFGTTKDTRQRIIIGLGNRIEFMIVAASTRDGQTQKSLTDRINLLIHQIHFELPPISLNMRFWPECKESGGHELIRAFEFVTSREQVTGNLLTNELIEGDIGVERVDDIIAIPLRLRITETGFFPARFGIASDIQPVSTPPFTKVPRRKQLLDRHFHGLT